MTKTIEAPQIVFGYGGQLKQMPDEQLRELLADVKGWLKRGRKTGRCLYLASASDIQAELADRARRVMETRDGRIGGGL
jgi:hypothetical protein